MSCTRACRGPLASFLPGFSMPTTTARILGMSKVLNIRAVGLYQVFRYISTPARERLSEQIREQRP
jgi:hypothetical protein